MKTMDNSLNDKFLQDRKSYLSKEKHLIDMVSLHFEVLHHAEVLITILGLNSNCFVWFNSYAQKLFTKKVTRQGLSESVYLRDFLCPDNHEWWHKRKEKFLLNGKSHFPGVYQLKIKCRDYLLYSKSSTYNSLTFDGNSHFIEVAMLLDTKLLQKLQIRHASVKIKTLADNPAFNSLSNREKEIISLILKGCTSKSIAKKLHISLHTVLTHRSNIRMKLNMKTLAWQGLVGSEMLEQWSNGVIE